MERAEEYQRFCAAHPLRALTIAEKRWEYIDTGGGGETLLLLPGGFGVADTSFRLIAVFSQDYRVLSVTYPTEVTTIDELMKGLAGLLEQTGVVAAHVLGGSASGLVAQCLVRRRPALVRSLVLSHTGVPQPTRARWMAPMLALLHALPFSLVRRAFHASVRTFLSGNEPEHQFWRGYFHDRIDELSPDGLLNRFRILLDIDRNIRFLPADLEAWTNPLLIVAAENDGFVGKREQAALEWLYPQAQYHRFPRGAHRDSVTAPEAEIAVIHDFLRRSR